MSLISSVKNNNDSIVPYQLVNGILEDDDVQDWQQVNENEFEHVLNVEFKDGTNTNIIVHDMISGPLHNTKIDLKEILSKKSWNKKVRD